MLEPSSSMQLVTRAERHQDRPAIISTEGTFTYRQLLAASAKIASSLLDGKKNLRETRVAFLIPPGFQYVATQWGIWRAGGIAVPLCVPHPQPELVYVSVDSEAEIIVAHPGFTEILRPLAVARNEKFLITTETLQVASMICPATRWARLSNPK